MNLLNTDSCWGHYIWANENNMAIYFLTNFFSFGNSNNWVYIEMSARLLIDFRYHILAVNNQ